MKRNPTRAIRLATAVSIAGVAALSAGPAFADSNINYFQGGGTGQAVNLQIAPKAALGGLDLNALGTALANDVSKLPAGVGGTIDQNLGGTLRNVDSPVTVIVDSAQVGAKASQGTTLTDGLLTGAPGLGAVSTPVDIDAKSLQSELATLKTALTDMPVGTDTALKQALQPLLAANPDLQSAINDLDPLLGSQTVADTLGAPTVSLQSISATLNNGVGQDSNHGLLTVNGSASQASLLNPGSTFTLDPFEARALPSDALANNHVTSLSLLGTGKVSLPSLVQLQTDLKTLVTALQSVETKLLSTVGNNSVVNLTTVTGALAPVLGTVNTTTNQALGTVNNVDLTAVNNLINSINATLDNIASLNGLQLADLVQNQSDTARATLQRAATGVTATGHSAVVDLSAVNLHSGPLSDLLTKITSAAGLPAGTSLVTVRGVTADASVTLDGVNKAKSAASGEIASIAVLGKVILGEGSVLGPQGNLDYYLPAGTQCVISIPAIKVMTCTNGKSVDLTSALGSVSSQVQSALGAVPALTVTLTRGAYIPDATDSVTQGHAAITTLEVTVDLAQGAVLNSVENTLNLGNLLLAAGPAHSAYVASSNGAVAAAATSSSHLVDLQLGVASANVSLTPGSITSSGPPPAKTGSEIVPLAILAMALLAGGIGIGVRQRFAVRRG